MFVFVIWDNEKNELFGVRDYFGIKLYYYVEMNGIFMFGLEIKSFLIFELNINVLFIFV